MSFTLEEYDENFAKLKDGEVITELEPVKGVRQFEIVIEVPAIKSLAEERRELLQYLAETDYIVIKIAEGVATAEEYKDVLTSRAKARARINEIDEAQDDSIK